MGSDIYIGIVKLFSRIITIILCISILLNCSHGYNYYDTIIICILYQPSLLDGFVVELASHHQLKLPSMSWFPHEEHLTYFEWCKLESVTKRGWYSRAISIGKILSPPAMCNYTRNCSTIVVMTRLKNSTFLNAMKHSENHHFIITSEDIKRLVENINTKHSSITLQQPRLPPRLVRTA